MSSKDIALKDIFEEIPHRLSKILAPAPIKELLPTNFPSTELRVDFLARLEDESVLHIEFQSFNDPNMPFRMLRYYLAILERYPSSPIKQLLVYVGNRKLRMKSRLRLRNLSFSYEILDIRQIDCRVLLESPDPMDRLLACLCKVEDEAYLIEKLIKTMESMNEEERKDYLLKALTLTELRPNLRIKLTEEVKHMPIVVRPEDVRLPKKKLRKDILYRLGLEEGEVIGIEKGLLRSAQDMLIAIIEGKLGYVPEEIANRIREIRDVEFLKSLAKKLVSVSEDFMQVLATELRIS
ncbi:MAG: Rpn family recombination-promoting nuclease/putative transposase [Thermoproteota archaeon]